ncbi:hypothetical protein PPSIR1_38114 [Plesiocystis pacifica SIR-1]|uniref:Uncharacterized protein n=2 Tax=Plesiocystis pacifica TaxID=191768 RepID=A6GBQ2_9BACT|nr:hypothetical protein PPSIR1_38114 [Plesiocystis pacifica SIR-1]
MGEHTTQRIRENLSQMTAAGASTDELVEFLAGTKMSTAVCIKSLIDFGKMSREGAELAVRQSDKFSERPSSGDDAVLHDRMLDYLEDDDFIESLDPNLDDEQEPFC